MVITVSHLSKSYAISKKDPGFVGSLRSLFHPKSETIHAVEDISFDIEEGELVGFIGPNGAGKTTTLKCLSGLLYPSGGMLNVLGYFPFDRKAAYLRQIGLVMGQKNQLWWDLPAAETFLLNKEIYEISDDEYRKTIKELVELLDAARLLKVQVRKLSLGERMKMELIAALIHKPKVLFLDEPTIGLDVVMQQAVRDFIGEYNMRTKATILLTSHYMQDVQQLASRVLLINYGKIIYDGTMANLVERYTHHKIISLILAQQVDPKKIQTFGKIISYNYPKVVLSVERAETRFAASRILKSLPVADVSIEEPEIEQIIRDVFTNIRA